MRHEPDLTAPDTGVFPPPTVRVLLSLRALPGRGMSSADSRNKESVVLACLRRLRIARSRRDLPLSPLERLQLRFLATRISAVPPHFPRLSPWTRVVRSGTGHASSTIEPVSHRDTTWEKHPLAPAFLVLSIHKVDTWLVENRTTHQLEK